MLTIYQSRCLHDEILIISIQPISRTQLFTYTIGLTHVVRRTKIGNTQLFADSIGQGSTITSIAPPYCTLSHNVYSCNVSPYTKALSITLITIQFYAMDMVHIMHDIWYIQLNCIYLFEEKKKWYKQSPDICPVFTFIKTTLVASAAAIIETRYHWLCDRILYIYKFVDFTI